MAKVSNPRKAFQFTILIAGIDPFLCQEVKLPDTDIDVVEHGDTNYDVKTAGKVKLGTLNIQKIAPSNPLDMEVWNWTRSIQNTLLGGGLLPDQYKRVVTIIQYAPDGATPLQRWTYEGVWPHKINGIEFSRMKSENTIENIDFSVDRLV